MEEVGLGCGLGHVQFREREENAGQNLMCIPTKMFAIFVFCLFLGLTLFLFCRSKVNLKNSAPQNSSSGISRRKGPRGFQFLPAARDDH